MAHGSGPHHHHHHSTPDASTRNIGLAFWLNLIFALIELAGGWWTQSLAITSDALHDFGDALSLGLGYFLQRKSAGGPTEQFSYGPRRLSLLSALISGVVISVGAIYIAIESIRSFNQVHEPHSTGMMLLAVLGIAVNGFAAWKLGHGHTRNEKVLSWHLIEDLMGWTAVLAGAVLIYFLQWNWLDPVLALGISAFILFNVVRGLIETTNLFLQANPNPEALRGFREAVEGMPEVFETHDVHFWSLDGVRHILSLHAVLHDVGTAEIVKEKVRLAAAKSLGDCHVTVEIESTQEHCHNDCEHTHK
jgi:cobalt-zinc-cadmium efflux system protein